MINLTTWQVRLFSEALALEPEPVGEVVTNIAVAAGLVKRESE